MLNVRFLGAVTHSGVTISIERYKQLLRSYPTRSLSREDFKRMCPGELAPLVHSKFDLDRNGQVSFSEYIKTLVKIEDDNLWFHCASICRAFFRVSW